MQCLQCQHENPSIAKFCSACGAPLAPRCQSCATEPLSGAKFCHQCGTALVELAPTATPAQRRAKSESQFHVMLSAVMWWLQCERRVTYRTLRHLLGVDDALLEEICEELVFRRFARDEDGQGLVIPAPIAETHEPTPSVQMPSTLFPKNESAIPSEPIRPVLEAERRQLTVMFCDLADSTKLSQQLDPEDLREVIRAYQQTSADVIQHFDGYIAQHLGDGLLIYFGWPRAHEDDVYRALHSGLGIVEAITTHLNPHLEQVKGVQLTVRLGVHTGPVVVGQMGSGKRQENLATGETVNIAARLESLAQPNTVVISSATERLARSGFALEELGPQVLKGVAEPMGVFRVVRPLDTDCDEHERLPESSGFLVGRDEEVGLLLRRWEQSKEGLGQVVLISGQGGIGKSALVTMVRTHVAQEGQHRITFRCSPLSYQSRPLSGDHASGSSARF